MHNALVSPMNSSSGNEKDQGVPRIGFYDIERTIGKGNFAIVKLARHRITKSHVAVKIINKSKLEEANLRKMYREIRIMQLINHPQIIKLYQVIETKTMLYLVTEYAEHGELFDHISKHGRMSEQNAKAVFAQIGYAVKYLHEHNIVHRDLKTENLLFDSHHRIKLADFGFANFFSTNELLSTWCGSPPYAAPEVFEGLKYHGPEIDIWSLGVILYVLVCGTLPFSGDTLQNLRDHVLSCRFRVPFFLSTVCEDLIKRMLVRNPSKRFTIIDVLQHQWLNRTVGPDSHLAPPSVSPDQRDSILRLMQSLGISPARVMQSVECNAFDNYASIFHLLAEKFLRPQRPDGLIRRPSSLAEQAIEQAVLSATASTTQTPYSENDNMIAHNNNNNNKTGVANEASNNNGSASSNHSGILFGVKGGSSTGLGLSSSNEQSESVPPAIVPGRSPVHLPLTANNCSLPLGTVFQQPSQATQRRLFPVSSNVFGTSPFEIVPGHRAASIQTGGERVSGVDEGGVAPTDDSNASPGSSRGLVAAGNHVYQQQQQFLAANPQPVFFDNGPAASLQHQYLSATSVPNSAAESSHLATLHPFVFMNSNNLLPASYYGAFVLQRLQMQQQQQQQQSNETTGGFPVLTTSANANSTAPMETASVSVIRQNPLCQGQFFDPSSNPSMDAPKVPTESNKNNNFAGRPPLGPNPPNPVPAYAAPVRRPPLLKRSSLPADPTAVTNSNYMNSEISGNNSFSQSFARAAGAGYPQHVFVPKYRRFHTVKLSPYPLPTPVEMSPITDNSPAQHQQFVFTSPLPSSSQLSGAGNSGSTAQLQVATELLTIDEQPQSAAARLAAAGVSSSRSIDVELLAAVRTASSPITLSAGSNKTVPANDHQEPANGVSVPPEETT